MLNVDFDSLPKEVQDIINAKTRQFSKRNREARKKIFEAIDSICYEFDLSKPIWLDSTIRDFQLHDKTRFTQDNFIDTIDFDFLEIHVIEEDY